MNWKQALKLKCYEAAETRLQYVERIEHVKEKWSTGNSAAFEVINEWFDHDGMVVDINNFMLSFKNCNI